jgi:ABC-type antimicrobial peptide transport system permease subunit
LLLAAVGVYGLIAYSVAERHREFGVRMALGARAGDVMRLVLGDAAVLTAAGLVVGLVAATTGATWLRRELYGVAPWDPAVIGVTVSILTGVTLAASVWPARRAVHTDPADALRGD